MRDFGDINELIAFARQQAVSVRINYWEASDELELEVTSAAPAENYYRKRATTVDEFISDWHEHIDKNRLNNATDIVPK